jgi:hypothetical protein
LRPVAYGKKPKKFKNYYDTACHITNSVMFITNPQPAIVATRHFRIGCVDYLTQRDTRQNKNESTRRMLSHVTVEFVWVLPVPSFPQISPTLEEQPK